MMSAAVLSVRLCYHASILEEQKSLTSHTLSISLLQTISNLCNSLPTHLCEKKVSHLLFNNIGCDIRMREEKAKKKRLDVIKILNPTVKKKRNLR
jgi:hypothetical protein